MSWNRRTGIMDRVGAIGLLFALSSTAFAQWDPANGDWSKTLPTDLRVMTWNVRDSICSTNNKVEGNNDWTAVARIVASMKPDILIMQETGDNAGNGTGGSIDTVANLVTTFNIFLHGGTDPFHGNSAVTAWVQKYAPAYDLPFIFVSNSNDSFNRNAILSRYPFADLNGDTKSQLSDILFMLPDLYAPGGNGGIRGFQFAEINLPDGTYAGNLVVGNGHLKSGGAADDLADRLVAAQNIAYFIDYFYNGAGTGVPDPNSKIVDSPPATMILPGATPIIIGGDWNEDELTNGRKGPAEWMTQTQNAGGTDGADRDRSDSTYDSSVHFFTGSRVTQNSGSKLDYLAWQDSIAALRRSFVFNTAGTPVAALPSELDGLAFPGGASTVASDHRPVIADFIIATGIAGACCQTTGICADAVAEDTCTSGGGVYQGDDTLCSGVSCPQPPNAQINEIRIDQTDTDNDEFFEITGLPGQSLSDLTYLVIGDGTGGSGVIEAVVSLAGETIPADGYFLAAESTFTIGGGLASVDLNLGAGGLNFENDDNVTHLLVRNFTGSNGQDLDSDDDGVLNTTPWTEIVDVIALIKSANPPVGTEFHYGPPTIGPDGANVPGLAFRCPDQSGAWQIGTFTPIGTDDTPGSSNTTCPGPPIPAVSLGGLIVMLLATAAAGAGLLRRRFAKKPSG